MFLGGIVMATKSFLKNVNIKSAKNVAHFASALECAEKAKA